MTVLQLFERLIGHTITLIQDPKTKHWRLGLDWNSDDDYFYICEYPTIEECLDRAITFVTKKK